MELGRLAEDSQRPVHHEGHLRKCPGIGLEYLQAQMGLGRQLDRTDALANAIGVLAGLATAFTPWRDALLRLDRRS